MQKKIGDKMIRKILIAIVIIIILVLMMRNKVCEETINKINIVGNRNVEIYSQLRNCGATTGYLNKIYLLKKEDNVGYFDEPIIATNDNNPKLTWISDDTLTIETKSDRIYDFTNYKYIDKKEYKIILINKVEQE